MSHVTRFWHSTLNTSRHCGLSKIIQCLTVTSFRDIECNCVLVPTNLKMATWAAETCLCLQCNIITFILPTASDGLCKIFIKVKFSRHWPGVAQRVGRVLALLFHDRGTRRGWVVSSTPRPHFTPGKDPVPILQEAGFRGAQRVPGS